MRTLVTKKATVYGNEQVYMRSYYDNSTWLVGEATLTIWKKEISVVGWQRSKRAEIGGNSIYKAYKKYETAWRQAYRVAIGTK